MQVIVADILSLEQYIDMLKANHPLLRPSHCLSCGKSVLHKHATYTRESDRENKSGDSLNPVEIQRYFCPGCKHTCSVLPECIPPKRWYLWIMQQTVIMACFMGIPLNQIARGHLPHRSTCRRWWNWIQNESKRFMSELLSIFSELGRYSGFETFWPACFKQITLSKVMYFCHQNGVIVP